eukprot:12707734-Alexandrium_andersonii.AAC.1
MTHVLADKAVLLPFALGQQDVAEHLPPLQTDEAVVVYEVDLEALLESWACGAYMLPNGMVELCDNIPMSAIKA